MEVKEDGAAEIRTRRHLRVVAPAKPARVVARGHAADPIAYDPITSNPSTTNNRGPVFPPTALLASLGCGNPTALTELRPGETVLDLRLRRLALTCAAIREARGADWKSLRAGYDR